MAFITIWSKTINFPITTSSAFTTDQAAKLMLGTRFTKTICGLRRQGNFAYPAVWFIPITILTNAKLVFLRPLSMVDPFNWTGDQRSAKVTIGQWHTTGPINEMRLCAFSAVKDNEG